MKPDKTRQEIQQSLKELCAQFGESVPKEAFSDIVSELISSLKGDINAHELEIYHELKTLLHHLEKTRQEIAAIGPHDMQVRYLRPASDQLDAVVMATEEATGVILDSVERIETATKHLTDPAIADSLASEITKIYEACNFQDITGQRISKVVATLHYIEEKLQKISRALENTMPDYDRELMNEPSTPKDTPAEEDYFLNGPQLPEKAVTQEEIDALLKE